MPENFKDLISKRSNIEVFKCSSQVFSAEGQKKNFGSYILLVCLAALIGIGVFHFLKEKDQMEEKYHKLRHGGVFKSENAIMNSNNNANPPKNQSEKKAEKENKEKKGKKESSKKTDKVKGVDKNGFPLTTSRKLQNLKFLPPPNLAMYRKSLQGYGY